MKKGILKSACYLATLSMTHAAVSISVVGDGTGYDLISDGSATHEVSAYRSTNIAKSFDVDGDNVYGTAGVFRFGDGGAQANNQPFTLNTTVGATFATFSAGAHFTSVAQGYGQQLMDDPTLTPGVTVADMGTTGSGVAAGNSGTAGNINEILTFTYNASTPQQFRIGLIGGTQAQTDGRWDPTSYILSDGTTSASVTGLENNGNGNANMVFFDIDLNGETSGTFSISAAQRLNGQGASLVGVTFDVIPEPSTTALLGLGSLALLRRRRK